MFYVKWIPHSVVLSPVHFGPKLYSTITRLVESSVEGTALSHYGYIIRVLEVPEDRMRGGVIEYDSGEVTYEVEYKALVFRPFKNEVVDSVVVDVNQLGFFAHLGPLRIFVSQHLFPSDVNGIEGGGFDGNSWVSEDGVVAIREGVGVRLAIIGATVEEGNITAVGTINEDFLGLIDVGEGEGM
ncbi:hypothetical protein TrCOL_g13921 [Triparma columacea]|uniref:S1 motif domain-containing protein n=1 Tax=Triparma columacea TaxID=722753 RepID=A0A9W7GIY7_9STRA|nr:hypothetical protein TrCOL_g13921 [Triparma columacea]